MMEQRARRARGVIWATGLLVLIWANFQILPMVVVYAPSASLRKGWYVRDFAARGVTIGDLVYSRSLPACRSA